jgi:translation initiation factor 2 subunit 2
MNYEDMLQEGHDKLPELMKERDRFEIPNVLGRIQGNKTVISNIQEFFTLFNRDKQHFIKFLLKELAAPGELRNEGLVLGRKVSASQVNEKIKKYADIYVICPECGKPDTLLKKENNVNYLVCQACGAKNLVRG